MILEVGKKPFREEKRNLIGKCINDLYFWQGINLHETYLINSSKLPQKAATARAGAEQAALVISLSPYLKEEQLQWQEVNKILTQRREEGLHGWPTVVTSQDTGAPALWDRLMDWHEPISAARGSPVCQELPHCLGANGVTASILPVWWDPVTRSWLSHGPESKLLHCLWMMNGSHLHSAVFTYCRKPESHTFVGVR